MSREKEHLRGRRKRRLRSCHPLSPCGACRASLHSDLRHDGPTHFQSAVTVCQGRAGSPDVAQGHVGEGAACRGLGRRARCTRRRNCRRGEWDACALAEIDDRYRSRRRERCSTYPAGAERLAYSASFSRAVRNEPACIAGWRAADDAVYAQRAGQIGGSPAMARKIQFLPTVFSLAVHERGLIACDYVDLRSRLADRVAAAPGIPGDGGRQGAQVALDGTAGRSLFAFGDDQQSPWVKRSRTGTLARCLPAERRDSRSQA